MLSDWLQLSFSQLKSFLKLARSLPKVYISHVQCQHEQLTIVPDTNHVISAGKCWPWKR